MVFYLCSVMILDISLPACWQELTPKQLRYVYFPLSQNYTADEVKTYCLCRFGGITVIGQEGDCWRIAFDNKSYLITAQQIAEQLSHLSWLDSLPLTPLRLPNIGRNSAVSADLSGVPFRDYLYCDNLYTGYLHTQNADLLTDIARQLYHDPTLTLSKEESVSIFYWFASLKAYYQRHFSYLFSTEPTQGDNLLTPMQTTEQRLQTAMDNQIRALTKGDVTKETEEDLLQHRTDGTDAFDTLYIGCSKFPQSHISPIVVSGVQ